MIFFFGVLFLSYSQYMSSTTIEKKETLSTELIHQMNQTIIEKTTNYLMPAIIIAETSARLARASVIDVSNQESLETYAYNVLKPHPQLARFYYGDLSGEFLMVFRNEDKTISTKIVNTNENQSIIKKRDSMGAFSNIETKRTNFEPRNRPWYLGAKQSEQRYWTDMYIFFTGKRPGITASYPAYDSAGQFKGVFGVDIELQKISEFLQSQSHMKQLEVFIINEKNQIVAQQGNVPFRTLESGEVEPLFVSELQNPVIKSVFDAYNNHQKNLFETMSDNIKYIASFTPFPEFFGKKWKIVTIVPEKELLGYGAKLQFPSYLFLGVGIILILIYAWFLNKKIASSLKVFEKDIQKVSYFNFDGKLPENNIGEIEDCVHSFKLLKQKIKTSKIN